MGKILQKELPRSMYLHNIGQLHDTVMESGCRDEAPTPSILKTISWEVRQNSRLHNNELLSLQFMVEGKSNKPEDVLQKVFLFPKGVLLWSLRSIDIYHERTREDILYLDATGSIMKKGKGSPPFYVYELVVRNPSKNSSPFPVATYLTCDHTTASVKYFLEAFLTDVAKAYGQRAVRPPLMLLCDGSIVIMQALCLSFMKTNLTNTIEHYYAIISGKGKSADFDIPVLHRCRSHLMKNAKEICRKFAKQEYHLAMHVIGLFTTATTLQALDDMVLSATVVFSSPCSGQNVEKHFKNLQLLMQDKRQTFEENRKSEGLLDEDIQGKNIFAKHFSRLIAKAPLDKDGQTNVYYCDGFIHHLCQYILPYAALWSAMMLGDLGRHGTGTVYENATRRYNFLKTLKRQNITDDNKTQGIMEKSQWDLKHVRFPSRRLTRLDDFVVQYQLIHTAMLKEFDDHSRSLKRKSFRVDVEKWKQRNQKKRGRYVKGITKPFHFKGSSTQVLHLGCQFRSITRPFQGAVCPLSQVSWDRFQAIPCIRDRQC
ncbi:uncharacterized protein LOC109513130 [Hippocampus comes]|uniref:uncharacterized protein LOC109513130 n=1 Tax=Hippocampus comes TaxID=109280 RepID=UPI00094EC2F3|nr:PREDICTED: uncharacterized protein LOC109513130 [Hippocampus comes]